jgi:hypothetical protein
MPKFSRADFRKFARSREAGSAESSVCGMRAGIPNDHKLMNEPNQSQVNWVTKSALADYFGCTPRYINTLMRRGVIPFVKTRGFLRFDLAECDLALQRFRTASCLEPPQRRAAETFGPAPGPKAPRGDLRPPGPCVPSVVTSNIRSHVFHSPAAARQFLDDLEAEQKPAPQCCGEGWLDDRALPWALIVIVVAAGEPK